MKLVNGENKMKLVKSKKTVVTFATPYKEIYRPCMYYETERNPGHQTKYVRNPK